MITVADIDNELGQSIMPDVFAEIFSDRLSITTEKITQGKGGGQIKTINTTTYDDIPVKITEFGNNMRRGADDPVYANNTYLLEFPVYTRGGRITIAQDVDRLTVAARGGEPEKVFRINVLRNPRGITYRAICTQES